MDIQWSGNWSEEHDSIDQCNSAPAFQTQVSLEKVTFSRNESGRSSGFSNSHTIEHTVAAADWYQLGGIETAPVGVVSIKMYVMNYLFCAQWSGE